MKDINDIAATVVGTFKVIGFLTLLAILILPAVVYKLVKPDDPFLFPVIFHRALLRVMNVRLRVFGEIAQTSPVLFVSNHTSYLDIPVLGALLPAGFVAKADVANWPLFGLLAKIQNSIFIERRTTRAAEHRTQLQDYLARKLSVILFPEGTSSNGLTTLPFKSSLFSIVEDSSDKPIPVQPVSLACVEMDGFPMLHEDRPLYAWYGDMTLVPHLWNVFKRESFTVDVRFHPPLSPTDFKNRKDLAIACQALVSQGLRTSLTHEMPPHEEGAATTDLIDLNAPSRAQAEIV